MKPVPLMATTDEELKVSPIRAVFDSTIGHSSIPNQVSITTNTLFGNKSISEAGLSQNSIFKTITEVGSIEVSTVSIHVGEDSSPQISFGQISATQINRVHIGISDDSTSETSLFQNRSKQIASAQIGLSKISLIQTSSTQINFLQTQPPQVDFVPFDIKRGLDQLNSSKVTLPLEVATNQFFWSHLQDYHFTSNFFSNLKYSANKPWQTFFDPTFNINFQITDLPTGLVSFWVKKVTLSGFQSFFMSNLG